MVSPYGSPAPVEPPANTGSGNFVDAREVVSSVDGVPAKRQIIGIGDPRADKGDWIAHVDEYNALLTSLGFGVADCFVADRAAYSNQLGSSDLIDFSNWNGVYSEDFSINRLLGIIYLSRKGNIPIYIAGVGERGYSDYDDGSKRLTPQFSFSGTIISPDDSDQLIVLYARAKDITVSVSGPIDVSGSSVSVSNFPASQAVTGTFFQATQPVSAATLPLPSGASTSALQSTMNTTIGTGNTSLASIDTKLSSQATAANQSTMNTTLTTGNTNTSNINTSVGTMSAKLPATLGQKTMANSMSTVISSDQSTLPVLQTAPSGTVTMTAAGQNVIIALNGAANLSVTFSLNSGSVSVGVQVSNDQSNWTNYLPGYNPLTDALLTGSTANITVTGNYVFDVAGFAYARVYCVTALTTPNATVFVATGGAGFTTIMRPLPAGANTIGSVQGNVPYGTSVVGGNPFNIGLRTKTTLLTQGDNTTISAVATANGSIVTRPFAIPEQDWSYAAVTGGITNNTAVAIKTAAGANLRNYITGISIINASATVATEVILLDNVTVIWRGYVGTNLLLNSVVGLVFSTPLKTTANTALNFQCVTTGSQVYVSAQGYVAS